MKLRIKLNLGVLLTLVTFLFYSCSPLDPKPDLTKGFIKYYTGVDYTFSSQLILTKDGGYAMIGSGLNDNNGQDLYVVKADDKGNKIWDKYLGSINSDTGYSIQEDADQNLIVLGVTNPNDSVANLFIAKTNGKSGDLIWNNQFLPNNKAFYAYDLKIINNGTSLLIGGSELNNAGFKEASVLKTDLNGNLIKIGAKNSSNYNVEGAYIKVSSIIEGTNSGFVWTGTTNNDFVKDGVSPIGSPLVGIFDQFGTVFNPINKSDSRVLSTLTGKSTLEMVSTSQCKKIQDGYILVGSSIKNNNSDAYLLKLNENLELVWYNSYNVLGNEYGNAVEITSDGGYIITGRKDISFSGNLTTSNTDIFVIKTDANGNVVWSKDFGGDGADFGTDVKQTPDGGFVILASVSLITSPQNKLQMALIKINADGKIEN